MDLTDAGLLERAWRVMGYDAIWDDYKAIRDAARAEQREIIEIAQRIDADLRAGNLVLASDAQALAAAIRAQGETR